MLTVAERCPSGLWCRSRKAVGDEPRGFESHPLRQTNGEVLEWTIRRAWRARVAIGDRGFESHPLRQVKNLTPSRSKL
jgi:hypothetical protein